MLFMASEIYFSQLYAGRMMLTSGSHMLARYC
jgi:hypothetical protein